MKLFLVFHTFHNVAVMHKIILIGEEKSPLYPVQIILHVFQKILRNHSIVIETIDEGMCIKFRINRVVRFVWFSEKTSQDRINDLEHEIIDSHTNRVIYWPENKPLPEIEQILHKSPDKSDIVDAQHMSPNYGSWMIDFLTAWLSSEIASTPAGSLSSVNSHSHLAPPPMHTSRPCFTSQSAALLNALQTHPELRHWNHSAQAHPLASRLLMTDQHLVFIADQLHNFIHSVKSQSQIHSYSRYYTKKDWDNIPIPTGTGLPAFETTETISWTHNITPPGTRERGVLFFTNPKYPRQYSVLFKSDIQIHGSMTNPSLGFMYKSGQTKMVKCHALLFKFHQPLESDTLQILSIQSVVTCSRFSKQRLLKIRNTLFDMESGENIQIPDELIDLTPKALELGLVPILNHQENDFNNWQQICFKHGQAEDAQKTILYYQANNGQKILKNRVQDCTTFTQRIYACLTFLSAIKNILKENYFPVDLKYDNMCVQYMTTPHGKMPKLSIIDFIGFAPTFSLFKRVSEIPFVPGRHLQGSCNLDEYGHLLHKLNYRRVISDDLFGGCLVRQLMFEIGINLLNIINQQSRASDICANFNQYFPSNQAESWLNQPEQMNKCFTTLLNECIYTKFEHPYFDCRYWANKWMQIGEQISIVYNKTVKIQKALLPTATIAEDPILGTLYHHLFSPENFHEWFELIVNFRNTPSPFTNADKKILFLKTV